jgi:hypothetical protein
MTQMTADEERRCRQELATEFTEDTETKRVIRR